MEYTRFVGLDIHKDRISIAVAESGRALGRWNTSANRVLGWTAPDGIDCVRIRSLQISNKGDHLWNRLAELAWILLQVSRRLIKKRRAFIPQ
jgi:hypothetical protein